MQITVSEKPLFSQKEWERRYAAGTHEMSQFMKMATNRPKNAQTAARFAGLTNFFSLFDLPKWHCRSTGVDVSVQEVDWVYPGLDQDTAEAHERYSRIVALLKSYHRSNKILQPTSGAP